MKITLKQIEKLNPCNEGLTWYILYGSSDLLTTLLTVNKERPDWALWLFTNLMTKKQCIEIAIFSAEQVLPIFEKIYPNDKRPHNAIKAAMKVLKNNTKKNRGAARVAANAIYATSVAYAAPAADAAYAASYAATDVIYDSYTASNAADAAANAANDVYAARAAGYAVKEKLQKKIIRKAVAILERK